MWLGVAVAVVVVLAVGVVLLKRAHPPATPVVPEADRIRRVTPAAPMVGLESALDGVTDAHGRTMRDQLNDDPADLDRLRVQDDTSPILRRALDEVAPPAPRSPSTDTGIDSSTGTGTDTRHDSDE